MGDWRDRQPSRGHRPTMIVIYVAVIIVAIINILH